ncbi:MAG: hypothetical protein A2283_23390 [Lentisphaerae bacterium RIFOXYA12_FULL_48_11]|nr:MAG: hypothetical protein A2283_23390 [Lentisphaerae bacterium RIFOXYA12_FULL_48_11]
MKYRLLGKTGLSVSEIGVGAWQLGGPLVLDGKADGHPELGRDFCINLIRQCGDLGINFIDTAEQYGNGESEKRVGEALKGHRDKWVISTKFGAQVGLHGERLQDASPARVPVSLEGSLKRLQTDYVDVYLYHVAPKPGEAEEVADFLLQAKKKGQVCAVGISTSDFKQVQYLHSLGCLDVIQFPHNIVSAQKEIRIFVDEHNLGGIVRGAFAGGRLSGKYFHQPPDFSPDDIRSGRIDPAKAAADYARFSIFEELLTPERSMVDLALRYILDEFSTSVIIPGGKSIEDYRKAVHAAEIPSLLPEERDRVKELVKKL